MPYRISPSNDSAVEHLKNGRWSLKQQCTSHENAVKAMQLLNMKEHDVTPKGGWNGDPAEGTMADKAEDMRKGKRNNHGQRVNRGLKR